MRSSNRRILTGRSAAFTLTELLVVLAVMAVLAALLWGGAQSAIRSTRSGASLANMKQLTVALLAYAADNNNMLPGSRTPSGLPDYSWDLQVFPYLGIQNGYSGTEISPQLSKGLNLEVFRCPFDSRRMAPGRPFYPRSYGITGTAINLPRMDGGIPGRRQGEGIRLIWVPKPSQYVILTRIPKVWESEVNQVGYRIGFHAYNGPNVNLKPGQPGWDDEWGCFGGKTAFGFADGHVAWLPPQEASLVDPNFWTIKK